MKRYAFFVYGVVAHLAFLLIFLYMAAFTGNFAVPKTVDSGMDGFSWSAVIGNTLLIVLFGVQHSIMARPGFKRVWTRILPKEIERSTYVMISNALMVLLMVAWQPVGPLVWNVSDEVGRALLWSLFATGWLMVPVVSLLINHFDLFGTRQVWLQLKGRDYTHLPFDTPGNLSLRPPPPVCRLDAGLLGDAHHERGASALRGSAHHLQCSSPFPSRSAISYSTSATTTGTTASGFRP